MRRHAFRILVFIFLLASLSGNAEGSQVLLDAPEWLTGVLCFNAYGDSGESRAVRDQYLYFCDFGRGVVTSVEIPGTGILTREVQRGGRPLLIWSQPSTWAYGWGYQSSRWGMSRVAKLVEDEVGGGYGDFHSFYPGSNVGRGVEHEGAFALLGVRDWDIEKFYEPFGTQSGTTEYYLCYAAAAEGELEIQMISVRDGEVRVYHRFPIDYRWEEWEYAISESGRIAWVDGADSNMTYISDGEGEVIIPGSSRGMDDLTWLNDNVLLYTQPIEDADSGWTLMAYDVRNGTSEPFLTPSGERICFDRFPTYATAVDGGGQYLAYYRFGETPLAVKNLLTGEEYGFDPWPDRAEESGEVVVYGYTADGVRSIEGDEYLVPGLVWLP